MIDRSRERNLRPTPVAVYGLAGTLLATSLIGLATFTIPKPASALPAYAQQTGLACGRCHVNAAGGGARTAFGNAYAANGHKVPSKGAKPGKTSETAPPAAVSPATRPIVLEYVPWTLHDPYYSHFLYSPDDYRK
ncbi:MAG: hypothetical protein WA445_12210 [Pseudolabrys sp.]